MDSVFQLFLETFWLYLPAMVANMAPIIADDIKLWPSLKRPLDGGVSWRGRRLLGDHKTVRGIFVGIGAALITAYTQYLLLDIGMFEGTVASVYQYFPTAITIGLLSGVGALGGDAIKSFFKRRLNISAGQSWAVIDQIDFVIGATLVLYPLTHLTLAHILVALITIGIGSYVVSFIGVQLHLKQSI